MVACELNKAFTSVRFKISLVILSIISLFQAMDSIINSGYERPYGYANSAFISLLSNNNNVKFLQIYLWIMPLILIFMYANNYNYERANGINNIYLTKSKRHNLILSKILVSAIASFVVFAMPLIMNYAVNVIFLHGRSEFFQLETYSVEAIGATLYNSIRHPARTYLIYMLIASATVSLLGAFSQCICVILKDKKIPYIATFAVWILYFSDVKYTIARAFVPFCLEYPLIDSLLSVLYFLPIAIISIIICLACRGVKRDEL